MHYEENEFMEEDDKPTLNNNNNKNNINNINNNDSSDESDQNLDDLYLEGLPLNHYNISGDKEI